MSRIGARLAAPAWRTDLLLLGAIAGLAFLVRLLPVLRGGGLYGIIDYDDGVYFGSAIALVHGRLPYRDFLLLHPPGILYVLAPFAALSTVFGDATAFAVARVAFMVLGAVNAALVVLVARPLGRRAALFAGGLYVVWQVAANVERTTWLIAPQNTLLLLALLVIGTVAQPGTTKTPGVARMVAAGVLLGLCLGVQLWGVVPIVVVLAWLALMTRRLRGGWLRPVLACAAGAGIAAAVVWLPFLLAAGPHMVRYVVVDQLGRAPLRGSKVQRIRAMAGLPMTGPLARIIPGIAVVSGFLGVAAMIAWAVWQRPLIRLWAALLAAQVAVLFVMPPLFHYAGWLAPAGAVAIGGAVDTVVGRVEQAGRRMGRPAAAVRAAYLLGLAILLVASLLHPVGTPSDRGRLGAAVANVRCVTADSPTLLIETGTLSRDLDNGCPLMLDPTGTSYDTDPGMPRSRRNQPEYQHAMAAYYGGSGAALFMRLSSDAFDPQTMATIRGQLNVARNVGSITVLVRSNP